MNSIVEEKINEKKLEWEKEAKEKNEMRALMQE